MSGRYDVLSPMERRVLLALLDLGDQKAVARSLGIGPETVKTHLRKARGKTGATGSFALARALATDLGHTPIRGMPPDGGATSGDPPGTPVPTASGHRIVRSGTELREVAPVLDLDGADVVEDGREVGARGFLPRMVAAALLVIMVSIAILLAFPLSESFQRLADRLDPPRH